MKRKLLSLFFAVFATAYFCGAQVVFDPATYPVDSLKAGMSIVKIGGVDYLQVILDGWNSSVKLQDPITITRSTSFTMQTKYAVGSGGFELSNINTFLKLANGDFSVEIGAAGAQSVAEFASFSVNIANQGTIGQLQVAGQQRTSWGAVVGDTLWVGKVTVLPDPTRFITKETFGTTLYGTDGSSNGKLKTTGDTLTGWKSATNCTWRWDDITTFTSTNGRIQGGGDSSLRVVNYGAPYTVPANYPSPSAGVQLLLTNRLPNYAGSWDTTEFSNIDIHGYVVKSVEFGLAKNTNLYINPDTNVVNVEYRIDGGSWVQLDTSLIPNFAASVWKYIQLPVADQEGEKLDIRIAGLNTTQALIDDLALVGTIKLADSIVLSSDIDTIRTSNGTAQLSAIVYPAEARQIVEWSVSSVIASIDADGLLTAVSNGTIIVTATTDDGMSKTYPIVIYGQKPTPMPIAKAIVGGADNAVDYTGTVAIGWDADSVSLDFVVADDSIVTTGATYQVDNIEIYFDIDNSKTIHWPRNQGWQGTVDATYDANDWQLRLVPGIDYDVVNTGRPALTDGISQIFNLTDTGYTFSLKIAWDALMSGYAPEVGDEIGFDVLLSDNDAVASDANRNQFTWVSSIDKAYNDPSLWGTLAVVEGGAFLPVTDIEVPSVPTNVAGVAGDLKATLTWDASTDNTGVLYYIMKQGVFSVDTIFAKATGNTYTFTGLTAKNYGFQVIAIDNHGNKSAGSATVYLDITDIVGTDVITDAQFGIYPNPVADMLNINNASSIIKVEVLGVNGNVVSSVANSSAELVQISTTDLASGMYFVRMTTADGQVVMNKFIKE